MKETLVQVKLSDIESNPNRDLKFNPLNPEKLAALVASIHETGFWSNVIIRPHPEKKGKYQLSYGHHRLQAAINTGLTEAEFVVRNLDENMLLKMMELENSEDYRYCPLSLLESVKAVVLALAAGRIAPFYRVEDGTLPPEGDPERFRGTCKDEESGKWAAQLNGEKLGRFTTRLEAAHAYREAAKGIVLLERTDAARYAPSFVPSKASSNPKTGLQSPYTALDIARFLGRSRTRGNGTDKADPNINAALDALYLLEVKAISTASIKDMNWAQLGRFVAEIKQKRERVILVEKKTKEQLAEIAEQSRKLQEEHRAKEKKAKEERAALVKKMAEAKRDEDKAKAKVIAERIEAKEAEAEKIAETFEVKKAVLETKVEEVKQKQAEAKKDDEYLPIRKEADRIVHLFERRDEEEVVKALSRKAIQPAERERLRQAAIAKGTWFLDWVAQQFLPPLSTKYNMAEYRRREAAKQAAEAKEKK